VFYKLILIPTITLLTTQAFAYDAEVCKKQRETIELQIKNAKVSNNIANVKRLEKALDRVNKVCNKSVKK